jgi:hypothetical protein
MASIFFSLCIPGSYDAIKLHQEAVKLWQSSHSDLVYAAMKAAGRDTNEPLSVANTVFKLQKGKGAFHGTVYLMSNC